MLQINNETNKTININNTQDDMKIIFFIEVCLLSFLIFYWLCSIRQCSPYWLFVLLNIFLLSFINLIF